MILHICMQLADMVLTLRVVVILFTASSTFLGRVCRDRRLCGLAVACWTTDHYHLGSNLGVGISEGCFVFDFASLPLEVDRPI